MEAISLGVGAISLAIEAGDKLIDFCHAWKSKDEDLDQIAQQMINLDKILTQLDKPLNYLSTEHIALVGNIKELRLHVNTGRVKLENIIKTYQLTPHQVGGIGGSLKEAVKKVKYIVKKKAIQEVKQTVQELCDNLERAKSTLQLSISCQQHVNGTHMIRSLSGIQITSSETKSCMRNIETQVNSTRQQMASLSEEMLPQIKNQLVEILLEQNRERDDQMKAMSDQLAIVRQLQQESSVNFRSRLWREQCLNGYSMHTEISHQPISDQDVVVERGQLLLPLKRVCTCRKHIQQYTQRINCGPLQLFRRQVNQIAHNMNCPMFSQTEQTSFYGLRVKGAQSLFRQTIEIAFYFKKASGLATIGSTLNMCAIYRPKSPAQTLIRMLINSDLDPVVVDRGLNCLKLLFDSGRASPYDVDGRGRNLLHGTLYLIPWTLQVGKSHEFNRIVEFLIEAQVPLTETDENNWTPLGELGLQYYDQRLSTIGSFFNNPEAAKRMLNMVTRSCVVGGLGRLWDSHNVSLHRNWVTLREFVDDFEDLASLGPLSRAILDQSVEQVTALLDQHPEAVDEIAWAGQTPLHLASTWPIGLDILLYSGGRRLVNQIDRDGRTVLDYAIFYDAAESVQVLLATVAAPGFIVRGEQEYGFAADLVQQALGWNSACPKAAAVVIRHLQATRKALSTLAQQQLPAVVWTGLAVATDRALDAGAYSVYCALLNAGVPVPVQLLINQNYHAIYHCWCLTEQTANLLWDLGFRDINTPDKQGNTPLGYNIIKKYRSYSYVLWLLSKDAIFSTPLASTTALPFYLARLYGDDIYYQNKLYNATPLRLALLNRCTDNCHCACSINGCTPLAIFLKFIIWRRHSLYQNLISLVQELKCDPLAIIHFITFTALGLTHTCCDVEKEVLRPRIEEEEEVEEIHDEEHLIHDELFSLIEEFYNQYQQIHVDTSFAQFLTGYWKDRMMEVLQGDPENFEMLRHTILNEPKSQQTLEGLMDDIMNDRI